MADKEQDLQYADREALDAELVRAVSDILSAEQEAKQIIAQAEASVKAMMLDRANRERDMREVSAKTIAAAHDEAVNGAKKRAEAESARRIAAAEKAGEELFASKQKQINSVAAALYKALGDKV